MFEGATFWVGSIGILVAKQSYLGIQLLEVWKHPQIPVPLGLGADLFWEFFSFFFGNFFRFSSGPAKCCILQHFLAKLTHLH